MNSGLKFLLVLAALAIVVGFAFTGGLLRPVTVTVSSNTAGYAQGGASNSAPLARPTPDPRAPRVRGLEPPVSPKGDAPQPSLIITNWDEHIDHLLADENLDDKARAEHLLAVFHQLPAEGQEAAANHLSNLVADQDYAPMAGLLTNSTLPETVQDVLLSDVLNRPNAVKLPALLSVARLPEHPKAGEAHDILELMLDQDFGDDWTLWETRVQDFLRTETAEADAPSP